MKNALFGLSLAFAGFMFAPVSADETGMTDLMNDTPWDWKPGDLVFRNNFNEFDDLVREAEGGDWATVGIMRASSGSSRVVYVDAEEGVTEMMIEEFIEDLSEDEYAVFRIKTLDVPDQTTSQGPLAVPSRMIT